MAVTARDLRMITILHIVRHMRVLLHDSTAGVEPDEMLRALVSGLLVVVACSLVGTWVVLRGLTFLGEALAHAVIPGAAAALLWGIDPVLGAALSAAVLVVGIGLVDRRAPRRSRREHRAAVRGDAVRRASSSLSSSHEEEVERLLFGDIAHADWGDIAVQAVAAALRGRRERRRLPRVPRARPSTRARRPASVSAPASRTWRCWRSIAVAVVSSFTVGGEPARVRPARRARRPRRSSSCGGRGCAWWCRSASGGSRWRRAAAGPALRHRGRGDDGGRGGRPLLRRCSPCSRSAGASSLAARLICTLGAATASLARLADQGDDMTEIGGSVEPGFEGVADAFRANFEEHGEVGAATAVYVGGTQGRRPLGRRRRPRRRHARTPRTASSSCSPPPRAPPPRAPTCSPSAATSTSTRRWPSTGPSSRPRARATSPCAGCCATRPGCPTSTPRSPSRRRWPGTR